MFLDGPRPGALAAIAGGGGGAGWTGGGAAATGCTGGCGAPAATPSSNIEGRGRRLIGSFCKSAGRALTSGVPDLLITLVAGVTRGDVPLDRREYPIEVEGLRVLQRGKLLV